MQLGISSFTYGWGVGVPGSLPDRPITPADLLEQARRFGVSAVQFGDNLPLHDLTNKELTSLRRSADELGISLEVGARKLTPDRLERYIDIAGRIGSPILRFVIDEAPYEPSVVAVTDLLKDFRSVLEEKRIRLAIENHDRLKAHEFARIVEGVGSEYVGICLDSANSLGAGEGAEYVCDILAPFTVNLHIKDFTVSRLVHKMGFIVHGAPAGQGLLPIPALLRNIERFGRCRSAILELWTPPQPRLADTLDLERQWAEQSIAYLAPLLKTT